MQKHISCLLNFIVLIFAIELQTGKKSINFISLLNISKPNKLICTGNHLLTRNNFLPFLYFGDVSGNHRNGRHRPQSRSGTPQRPRSTTPQYTAQYTQPHVPGIHPANHRPSHLHNTHNQPIEARQGPPVLPPRGLSYSNGPHKQVQLPLEVPY